MGFFDTYLTDLKRRAILKENSIDVLASAPELDFADVGRIATAKTRGDDRDPVRAPGEAELVVVGSDEKNYYLAPTVSSLAPLSSEYLVLPSLGAARGFEARGMLGASLTYLDIRTIYQLRKRATSFVDYELSDADKGTVRAWIKRKIDR